MNNNTLVEIDGLCEILGIGKNTAYELLNNNEIDAFKIGTVWKIPKKSIDEFIERKCKERKRTMCEII